MGERERERNDTIDYILRLERVIMNNKNIVYFGVFMNNNSVSVLR